MSDNTHVTAIKAALDAGFEPTGDWEYISAENQEAVLHHAQALATELAEATARAARLRKAVILLVNRLNAARGYEDQTGVQIESDLSWEDLHLRYGDLDAAPGGTEGETQP